MEFDPETQNDKTMQFVVNARKQEVNRERLAELINSLEDLSAFYQNMPNPKIKREIGLLIDDIIKASQGYSISETLQKFFILKDTSSIFDYIKHLKLDIVTEGEET